MNLFLAPHSKSSGQIECDDSLERVMIFSWAVIRNLRDNRNCFYLQSSPELHVHASIFIFKRNHFNENSCCPIMGKSKFKCSLERKRVMVAVSSYDPEETTWGTFISVDSISAKERGCFDRPSVLGASCRWFTSTCPMEGITMDWFIGFRRLEMFDSGNADQELHKVNGERWFLSVIMRDNREWFLRFYSF